MGGELLAVKGEAFPGNAVEYELSRSFAVLASWRSTLMWKR
jgi:hypothetical protein